MQYLTVTRPRDTLRAIREQFFPYLVALLQTWINDAGTPDEICNLKAAQCLFLECRQKIDKKLQGKGNSLKIDFTFAQALALHTMLLEVQVSAQDLPWLTNSYLDLVQEIHDYLHA